MFDRVTGTAANECPQLGERE